VTLTPEQRREILDVLTEKWRRDGNFSDALAAIERIVSVNGPGEVGVPRGPANSDSDTASCTRSSKPPVDYTVGDACATAVDLTSPAPAPLALKAHEWREQYGDEATARVGFKAPGTVTGMVDGALWLALHMAASQPAPLADADRAELAQFRALRDMIAATDIGNSMEQAGRVGEWYNGPKACEERISLETSEPRAEMVARKSNLTAWGDAYLRAERALAMNEVDRLRQFCRRIARVGKGE
jgi:hypothetical protein